MILLNIESFLSRAEPGRAFKILRKRGGKGKGSGEWGKRGIGEEGKRGKGEKGERVKGKG
jgi:hypothetical protein